MTHLYLIRHGESYANVNPGEAVAGMRGDKGLTPLGFRQAERLRDRLARTHEIAADVLYASTLPRARQTAETIAPALGLPIQFDDDLHELRPGEADGMTWKAMLDRYGHVDFRNDPYSPLSPGGETWAAFVLRVGKTLRRLTLANPGKTVVAVCHGGVIDASFAVFFNMPLLAPPPARLYTHNTSITHWEYEDETEQSRHWRLVRYNDDAHVRDIVVDERFRWQQLDRDLEGSQQPAIPIPTEDDAREEREEPESVPTA